MPAALMVAATAVPIGPASAGGPEGIRIAELVIAAILILLGLRSLVRWLRSTYRPATPGERALHALHVTARVGMWFAFGGFFAGYGLVDEPQAFRWYVMVPLGLAALQLLTALALGLGRPNTPNPNPPNPPPDGQPG